MADDSKPKAPKAQRPPSARRLAAVEAYNKQFGRAPTKSMTITAMEGKVAAKQRYDQYQKDKMRIVDASGLGGTERKPLRPLDPPISTSTPQKPKSRFKDAYDRASPEKQAKMRETLAGIQKSLGEAKDLLNKTPWGSKPATPLPASRPIGATPVSHHDSHMGGFYPPSQPQQSGPSMLSRVNTGLAVVGAGVAAAQGYSKAKAEGKSTGEAVWEGTKSGALPAALAAAKPIGSRMASLGGEMLKEAGHMLRHASVGDAALAGGLEALGQTGAAVILTDTGGGLALGAAGGILKTVGTVAKVAGKVAAPAIAGYQAYQGYKEDGVRGAVKGAVTAFDPTEIGRLVGFKQGIVGWGFDKVRDMSSGPRGASLSKGDAAKFAAANQSYTADHHMTGHDDQSGAGKRGWANPANQRAAQEARGVKNLTDWAKG